jgi:hypothetical protein
MRPVQFKPLQLTAPPPRFDDGDPHLRAISPPAQRAGGLWLLSERGAPATRIKIRIERA